jgi:hypothetical protein
MHEVVVMNRLEQLRKKQRDEALQAQEELLAEVPRGVEGVEAAAEQDDTHMAAMEDEAEPYDRNMSPVPVELPDLHPDERQIETIDELSDRAVLVSVRPLSRLKVKMLNMFSNSSRNVVLSLLLASYLARFNKTTKTWKRPAELTSRQRRCTKKPWIELTQSAHGETLKEKMMGIAMKNSSTSKNLLPTRSRIHGRISIVHESRGISIAYTPAMSGINITRRITSEFQLGTSSWVFKFTLSVPAPTIHPPKSYKDTR